MIKGLQITGCRDFRTKGFNFWLCEERDGKYLEAKSKLEMVERELFSTDGFDNTFHVSDEAAQALLDDLWAAGYRPSNGNGHEGQLAATKDHLADMRKIAFNKLHIQE